MRNISFISCQELNSADIDNPFDELPESLVEEMLDGCPQLSENLSTTFQRLFKEKDRIRQKLKDTQMLKKDTELRSARVNPTSCGVDGSYAIEKLLATDMIAFAAVAVEGLTPPSDKRYWPNSIQSRLLVAAILWFS